MTLPLNLQRRIQPATRVRFTAFARRRTRVTMKLYGLTLTNPFCIRENAAHIPGEKLRRFPPRRAPRTNPIYLPAVQPPSHRRLSQPQRAGQPLWSPPLRWSPSTTPHPLIPSSNRRMQVPPRNPSRLARVHKRPTTRLNHPAKLNLNLKLRAKKTAGIPPR